jgi:uncharacterized damage-inducible protein DinB
MSADAVREVKKALVAQMEALRDEVKHLAEPLSEERFWKKPVEPGNSFGHLVLHLTGNVSHFAGARLGNTGYLRDREREFAETVLPSKREALAKLDEAVAVYCRVVESLTAEAMAAPHPDAEKMGSAVNALTKVLAHFALHRGQMSYIARLV